MSIKLHQQKIFSGMRPKKDRDKYFRNLRITYEGEITEIIEMANQKLIETSMSLKDIEIKESKTATYGLIQR